MSDGEDHREFILSALRGASLRCKLYDTEISSIGIALKARMITVEHALTWIKDAGVADLVCRFPEEISELEKSTVDNVG